MMTINLVYIKCNSPKAILHKPPTANSIIESFLSVKQSATQLLPNYMHLKPPTIYNSLPGVAVAGCILDTCD